MSETSIFVQILQRTLPVLAAVALPTALAGCGENTAPAEAVAATPAASPAAAGAAPAAGHAAPASNPAPAAGHGGTAPAATPANAHGSPMPATAAGDLAAAHEGPAVNRAAAEAGDPAMAHGGTPTPAAAHGGAPMPATAHGGTPAPAAAHGGAPMPATAHGGAPTPAAAHGGEEPAEMAEESLEPANTEEGIDETLPGDIAAEGEGEMPAGTPGEAAVGGESGNALRKFDEGTAEYAVQQLVVKLINGETTGMDALITESTTDPILVPIRDGMIDDAVLAKAKAIAAAAAAAGGEPRIREAGGMKIFTVRSRDGQSLSISAKREGDGYKVHRVRLSEGD